MRIFLLVLLFVGSAFAGTPEQELTKSESWLLPLSGCPADLAQKKQVDVTYDDKLCAGNMSFCMAMCKKNKVNYCYNAAQETQRLKLVNYEEHAEALYAKSCSLGAASGCTNSAATSQNSTEPKDLACVVRTYKKSCEWSDPWGCTMYGYHLAHGKGVPKNLEAALAALSKSCKYGDGDPACANAKALIEQIKDVKR